MKIQFTAENFARTLLMATLVAPLLLVAGFLFPYVSPRAVFFRILVESTFGILIWLLFTRRFSFRARTDYFLWALAASVVIAAASAMVSPARNHSMFGDLERMGGVWASLHVLGYYVLLRAFFRPQDWVRFLKIASVVGGVVSLFVLRDGGGVSTIGNTGLLGIYLFFTFLFPFVWITQAPRAWEKVLWLAIALLNLAGLILAQNRSSLGGIILGLIAGIGLYALKRGRQDRKVLFRAGALAAAAALALTLVFAMRTSVGFHTRIPIVRRVLETNFLGSDAKRAIQWRAAANAFSERPVLGFGPENYHLVWSANFDPTMYDFMADQRWDRAHNAFLEALSTTGILGALAFIALWAALGLGIFRAMKSEMPAFRLALLTGIFTGYLFWLIFWFFDLNSTMLWIGAAGFLFSANSGRLFEFAERVPLRKQSAWILALGGLTLAGSLYIHGYHTLRVARLLHRTQEPDITTPERFNFYFKVFDSPAPLTAHTFYMYGRLMSGLAPDYELLARSPQTRPLMDSAFSRGFVEFEEERMRDPLNEAIYIHQARLGLLAASFYKQSEFYNYSVKTIKNAIAISPRRLQPRVLLAYILVIARDFEGARAQLAQAKSIYARSGQVYYYSANLEFAQGNIERAVSEIETASKLGYFGDLELYVNILKALGSRREYAAAARMVETYFKSRRPAEGVNAATASAKPTYSTDEIVLMGRLPLLWARAGETGKAITAATALANAYPGAKSLAASFIDELNRGSLASWENRDSLLARSR